MLRGMALMNMCAGGSLRTLLRQQSDLITRSQALAVGITNSAIRHRLRPDGPWTAVLPGVYLVRNGLLAGGQREIAAVLYAGSGSVVTGPAALRRHGVRVPASDIVDVLVPVTVKRQSAGFVQVHRTRRMPERGWLLDEIRYAPAARAVADAVWGVFDQRSATALVADAVQQGACTVDQLTAELLAGPKQGSAALRVALADVTAGIASVAESDFRALIKAGGLPEPLSNPRLFVGSEFLAKPDAWWPDAGVAAEVDSREWHLSSADWARTMARHSAMSAQGIIVMHYPPSRIRSDPRGVAAELRSALDAGRGRAPLAIRTVPAR